MAVMNITSIKVSSNGLFEGDNPLHCAFPLLIIQTTLILVITRMLAFIFKPLRQPKVIAEIVGGVLLGPSAFGRSKSYMNTIFPNWSMPILESVSSIGLLFFLFLVGLELDLSTIRRSGKRAFSIAAAGISVPFISGCGVAFVFRNTVEGADKVGYGQFLVFMGVALSITAFPVLARILAELKLLTTRVGETAMAAAAFNDVAAWILLALAIALAGDGDHRQTSPLVSLWVLLCGAGFVLFMAVAVRPLIVRITGSSSSSLAEQTNTSVVNEAYIALTLIGVLVSGLVTDLIGIHSIFGAFVFGLIIPKGGDFAEKLLERIEDFVTGLLLPLYFASSGLKTDVATIKGGVAWGLLALVIFTACAGKIVGTMLMAMASGMPARESLTLGFLMNTKGLVELIVLNIGREKKVLNDQMFAILVLMALFTTFITTPSVMALYKQSHRERTLPHKRRLQQDTNEVINTPSSSTSSYSELRVVACLHNTSNVPSIINLIESIRSVRKSKLKLYAVHLVELTERSSSIIMVQRLRRNGVPFIGRRRRSDNKGVAAEVHDHVTSAFEAYGQLGQVKVRPITAISALHTMHEDICHVAEEKRVAMIVLPFHKRWIRVRKEDDADDEEDLVVVENVGHEWRGVNQKVLKHAPCSVAVLVDRGFGIGSYKEVVQNVCVIFFGGPDDREAVELGARMAEHPTMKVVVVRFVESPEVAENGGEIRLRPTPDKCAEKNYSFSVAEMNRETEKELDEASIREFNRRCAGAAEYTERITGNIIEDVLAIGRSGQYNLIVVGKGRFPSKMVAGLADIPAEHAELGPIGDILSSSTGGVLSSLLIVQQHDLAHVEEVPASKVVQLQTEQNGGDQSEINQV